MNHVKTKKNDIERRLQGILHLKHNSRAQRAAVPSTTLEGETAGPRYEAMQTTSSHGREEPQAPRPKSFPNGGEETEGHGPLFDVGPRACLGA